MPAPPGPTTSLPTRTTPGTPCVTTRGGRARMEYFIAVLWGVTGLCGILLMVVYWTGGQAQLEGLASPGRVRLPGRRSVAVGAQPAPRPRHHRGQAPARLRPGGAGRRRRFAGTGSRADDVPPWLPGEEGARAGGRHLRYCGTVAAGLSRASSGQRALPHQVVLGGQARDRGRHGPCTSTTSWSTG